MAVDNEKVSKFLMATGPRGSNKSLLLTSLITNRVLKAYYRNYYYHTNKKVWCNYPVVFWHRSRITGKIIKMETIPLNREALMCFDDEYVEGDVYIDEFDQWFDRQDWQDGSQKLTQKAVTQIRKRHLNLGGTMQSIEWANSRLNFQIDIQVECRDAAFTPFGAKQNLEPGEGALLTWKDLSGINTGYMFKETGRTYKNMFWGKRFWYCYDTNHTFDPTESMTRYKIKRPVKVVTFGEDGEVAGAGLPGNKINPAESLLADVIFDLKNDGINTISKVDLQMKAREKGFDGEWRTAGFALSKLGVVKANSTGSKYNLEFAGSGGGGQDN
jgi:hypothetical protein